MPHTKWAPTNYQVITPFTGGKKSQLPNIFKLKISEMMNHNQTQKSPIRKKAEFHIPQTWLDKQHWIRVTEVHMQRITVDGRNLAALGM